MGTVKRKMEFISMYSIGAYESWLSDLAASGLFLKKFGFMSCLFEKAEPARVEYRIDISKERLSKDRIVMYEDCGWKYIATNKWVHVFCAESDTQTTEIHTDAKEQGFTLVELNRTMGIIMPLMVLLVSFEVVLWSYILFLGGTPFLNMLSNGETMLIFVFLVILMFFVFLKQFFDIRALKKSLFSGKAINHHASWKKHKYYNNVVMLISLFIVVVSLISQGFTATNIIRAVTDTARVTMTAQTKLPCLRLSDLENLDNAVTGNEFLVTNDAADEVGTVDDLPGDTLIYYGSATTDSSLLAMTQIEVTESAATGDESFAAVLDTKYYKLTFAGMADGTLHDLMKRDLYTYTEEMMLDVNIKKMDFDGLDIVYTAKAQRSIFIFASKGNIVVSMQYYGTKSEPELIAALAEKLNENT